MSNKSGWQVHIVEFDDNTVEYHIVPVCDDKEHEYESTCSCGVTQGEDGEWIHASFDGRELYETGQRKLN